MDQGETRYLLVLCTCPDRAVGEAIAEALVQARLAACVNVVEGLTSVYEWEGRIEKDAEALLLIKTRSDRFAELEQAIGELHPYELPEIVAVALHTGLVPYLRWIDDCLTATPG